MDDNQVAPLPIINLDPRNETEIIQKAAETILRASRGQLNDFSAGSPVMALLEGQVFANSELHFYINRLPQAYTLEFLARVLRTTRSYGSKAVTVLQFKIKPQSSSKTIPKGTQVRTLLGLIFETESDLVVGPGQTVAEVRALSQKFGSDFNVPKFSLNNLVKRLSYIESVTNITDAENGLNPESLEDSVRKGFEFTSTNTPVSFLDWTRYAENFLGIGAPVIFKNRRPSPNLRPEDVNQANGQVYVWALNQDSSLLDEDRLFAFKSYLDQKKPLHYEFRVSNLDREFLDIRIKAGASMGLTDDYPNSLNANLRRAFRPHNGGPNFPGQGINLENLKRFLLTDYQEIRLINLEVFLDGKSLNLECFGNVPILNDHTSQIIRNLEIELVSPGNVSRLFRYELSEV